MINRNWPRWIRASTAKWFSDRMNGLYFYVEGSDSRTKEHRKHIEFRLDGPFAKELSHNYWQLDIEINLLVSTIRDDSDLYEHERSVGIACEAMTAGIPVWKYGDGPDDDPISQLGCLLLIPDNRERIIVSNFGLIKEDSRILQSTVEAHYRLNLKT